jgi:hypothetical protein
MPETEIGMPPAQLFAPVHGRPAIAGETALARPAAMIAQCRDPFPGMGAGIEPRAIG